MRSIGTLTVLATAALLSACATTPEPSVSAVSYEQKLAWILRLEDQRVLRDPPPPVDPAASGRTQGVVPPHADLTRLAVDRDSRIRRRAALGIGRVGLPDGIQTLTVLLADTDHEVRAMAAFSLGLIGDAAALESLVQALDDPSALVQGNAAQALGLIGDRSAAAPVAALAKRLLDANPLPPDPPEEADRERSTPLGALRLSVFALAHLGAYDELAGVVLEANGQPRSTWWPIAWALQHVGDSRAQPALRTLLSAPHVYTRMFAVRGLGNTRDVSAVPALVPLLKSPERLVAVEAARALGRIGDPAAGPALTDLLTTRGTDPYLRIEAAQALVAVDPDNSGELMIDLLGDPVPVVRAAALRTVAASDPEGFVFILSGMDPDRHWSVRAALASVLGALPADIALPRLRNMLGDEDARVLPAVIEALASLGAPDAADVAASHLTHDDPVVRAAAARALGSLKAPQAGRLLAEAYHTSRGDLSHIARAAAVTALAQLSPDDARPVLEEALQDPDWSVRLHAATLLNGITPASDGLVRIRPAPSALSADRYAARQVLAPPFSTQLYVETSRGTVQIELAVLDAPLTIDSVVTLARRGFYDGLPFHQVVPGVFVQTGDPRGDGEGGPGYTIRSEVNDRPFLRGTVGMALGTSESKDTGASQFFITQSPRPEMEGRYTVIGRVISGMEVVDAIQPGDTITRIHVWDGQTFESGLQD